jgi:hypothetical protein
MDKNCQPDTSSQTPNRSDNMNQQGTPDTSTLTMHLSTLNTSL